MNQITVKLYYHLKERAGTGQVLVDIPEKTTIKDLKAILIEKYPALQSQLDNILMLIDQKVALDEDLIPKGAQVSFLTPIGGG
jgi:sulfur-carrier protein